MPREVLPIDQTASPGHHRKKQHRTPAALNELVIALMSQMPEPATAYEIAATSEALGKSLSAMQVYRVLDRLIAEGRVRRIECLSAYVITECERPIFLVCKACRSIAELPGDTLMLELEDFASKLGFAESRPFIEAVGVCFDCTQRSAEGRQANGEAR
ncbi:hypothetical protein ACFB49_32920 [Sphingomonas sp. DBB INV C78]|uniref:Fur family transcriptional regulator n=1 Tax=Sphingomonas sp. DBB INV C78 TaxID=3349434 RepID=UPI0036D34294